MARLSLTAKAGIILILSPCLWWGLWAAWHYSRTWAPVDMPISLSRGHVRTAEFKLDLESDYAINLAIQAENLPSIPCPDGSPNCQRNVKMARAGWSLLSHGKVVYGEKAEPYDPSAAYGQEWTHIVGRFHANRGVYALELDLVEDLSQLDSFAPRLQLVEDGGRYGASFKHGENAVLGICVVVPMGLALLILAAVERRRENWNGFLRRCTLTAPGPGPIPGACVAVKLSPPRKVRRIVPRAFSVAGRFNLNHLSLMLALLLMLLWATFVLLQPSKEHVGFAIHTIRPQVQLLPVAGITPLRIRVRAGPLSPWGAHILGLQIGPQIISPADFEAFLRGEIAKRPSDWPVYIEADPDLEYESVAWAIDAVSAFHTKVILLTPGLKADLGEPAR